MPQSDPDLIIHQLWESTREGMSSKVLAILDAARNESIYPAVMDFDGEYCCLFGEGIPEVLAKASPYLVRLDPEDDFTAWLVSEGWGDNWGIFLESGASMEELRQHFRGLLKVEDEDGKELFFRYYDPRVLRAYLLTCNETDLDTLFGPVYSLFFEGEDPNALLKYSRGYAGWTYENISES